VHSLGNRLDDGKKKGGNVNYCSTNQEKNFSTLTASIFIGIEE